MKRYLSFLCLFLLVISSNAQNLLPSNGWTIGTGSIGNFTQNGSEAENERVMGMTPYGSQSIVWESHNDDGDYSGMSSRGDGGWHGAHIPIDDNTQTYRLCVWIKMTNSIDGRTYFGCNNNNPAQVTTLSGTDVSNPYFWSGNLPELDKWYLLVGYVIGSNVTNNTSLGAIYDGETFEKVISMTDYKFKSSTTTIKHRTYLYYDDNLDDIQYFYAPRIDVMDGSEPSLHSILNFDLSQLANFREIKYEYDLSGNRVNRTLGTIEISVRSASVSVRGSTQDTTITNEEPKIIENQLATDLKVKIYPNPTEGLMKLEIAGLENYLSSSYTIYDVYGKEVTSSNALSAAQQIDIQGLPAGNYVMILHVDGQDYQWKVIKK